MFKIAAVVVAALVGYVFYQNIPDLRRYMRIRSM